jgi:hypothetical protein
MRGCAPVFDVLSRLGGGLFEEEQRAFADWLRAHTSAPSMRLEDCAQLARREAASLATHLRHAHVRWLSASRGAIEYLDGIARRAPRGRTIELTDADWEALLERTTHGAAVRWPVFFSPDILIDADSQQAIDRGDYLVVLGEIHASVGINGFYSLVSSEQAAVKAASEEILRSACRGLQPVDFITAAENKTFLTLDLDLPEVPHQARSRPGRSVFPEVALRVHLRNNEVALEAEGCDRPLFIINRHPNRLRLVPLRFFTVPNVTLDLLRAPLFNQRTYLPRIQYGRTVLQRETWTIGADMLAALMRIASPSERFGRARALLHSLGTCRHVFCRLEGDAKPLYVDADSWLLVDGLIRRSARYAGKAAVFTEMLPAPDRLWLTDRAGRHTSEFRFTVFRDRGTPPCA